MDKLNEMLIGMLAVVGGFVTKRIFNNHDALTDRIAALEKVVITKAKDRRKFIPILGQYIVLTLFH